MSYTNRTDYIRQTFTPDTPARAEGDISITPETERILQLLIRLGDIRRIVEIGTFSGHSALCMAHALPEDGRILTLEKDQQRAKIARQNLAQEKRILLVEGDALDTLATLAKHAPYDMVFIDADKLNYAHYLDWAENNVRKGGLIIGDNTFLFDAVWRDGAVERVRETARTVMREFNARLANPEKYTGIMLDTPEGLTIAVKQF